MIEISLIMVAYNAEAYIREALDSALAQSYRPSEIIVLDDGSTDNTQNIINEYIAQHPQIRLIKQNNQGVGAAKNAAVRACSKPWIAILDADDTWQQTKLEEQAKVVNSGDESLGLVYCWSTLIDSRGNSFRLGGNPAFKGQVWGILLTGCFVGNGSTPLIRKEAFERAGGYHVPQSGAMQGTEDWALYIRIAENYSFDVVEHYLVNYRIHDANVSSNFSMMEEYYSSMIQKHRIRYISLPERVYRYANLSFYFYLMTRNYSNNNFIAAYRCAYKVIRNDPAQLLNLPFWRIVVLTSIRALLKLFMGDRRLAELVEKIRKNRTTNQSECTSTPLTPKPYMHENTYFNKLYWKRIQDLKKLDATRYMTTNPEV